MSPIKVKTPQAANGTENGSAETKEAVKGSTETNGTTTSGPQVDPGSLTSSVRIYRKDDKTWTTQEPEDGTEPAENKETACHALLLRHRKSTDSRKKYELHSIVVQSPWLKKALETILDGYPGICCTLTRLEFQAPFECFVHRWTELNKFMANVEDEVTKNHLQLLHSVLTEEVGDVIKAIEDYHRDGVVSFEHAWTIFQPGSVVLSLSGHGSFSALELKSARYAETRCGMVYRMYCKAIDWDGKDFGWSMQFLSLAEFSGLQPIQNLQISPLDFHPQKEQIKAALIEQGSTIERFAGTHYKSYNGFAIEITDDGDQLIQHDGRIVIDTKGWNKFSSHSCIIVDALPRSSSNASRSGSSINANTATDALLGGSNKKSLQASILKKFFNATPEGPRLQNDYQRMLCTPILRGYSLSTKKWLKFLLGPVGEIEWNTKALQRLILPDEQKELILALSQSQATQTDGFDDVIKGKGLGMIVLLSGLPGIGKTLTAEVIAENMKVPLFMMSAGDLGIDPNEVERKLNRILEMVAAWGAILLIDECDVFLEERSVHDLERNKLVSIFLRLMEYYQGTLFLTTNRVDNIDPAFQSRIHVHMAYPNLTTESRKLIWENFITKLSIESAFTADDLAELSELNLNGRQIKNMMKTAQLLAIRNKQPLAMKQIKVVLAIQGFEKRP